MRLTKQLKRVVVCLLLFFSISNTIPAAAYTNGNASDANLKVIVNAKMQTLTKSKSGYLDDRGILYYLANLNSTAMWNDVANSNMRIDFSENILTPYKESLALSVQDFNSRYDVSGKTFTPCKIQFEDRSSQYGAKEGLNAYAKDAAIAIINTSASKASSVFTEINVKLSGKTDEEKKVILDENSMTIKALYNVIQRTGIEYKNIQSLFSIDGSSGNSYALDITSLTGLVNKAENQDIVRYAQDLLEESIKSKSGMNLTDSTEDYDKFMIQSDSEYLVNLPYLAVLSSSAVYRPFSSKVGEESFITALKGVVGEDNSEVIDLYNRQKDKLKPLYFREMNKENEPSGSASRITVQDFFTKIGDESAGCLVTITGSFKRSADTDSWMFSQKDKVTLNSKNGLVVDPNAITTPNTTSTPTNNGTGAVLENDDGSVVELSDTITETDRMTKPLFKFGKKGEQAVMGKVLMWNILKDYKKDDLESEYDKQLLFINTFGDIVLSDKTVVIPAASNPTYYNEGTAYNPNTAAFMNSYPKASLASKNFEVSDRDAGKYLITMNYPEALTKEESNEVTDIYTHFDQNQTGPTIKCDNSTVAYIIGDNKDSLVATQIGDDTMPLELTMYDEGAEKIQTMKAMKYNFTFHFFSGHGSDLKTSNRAEIVPDSGRMLSYDVPSALFPLEDTKSEEFNKTCIYIANKFFDGLTRTEDGSRSLTNGRFDYLLVKEMYTCNYSGNANVAVLTKNIKEEYSNLDETGKITKILSTISQKVLDTVGKVSGVVGLKNAYQDNIFGTILNYSKKFMPFIMVIVALYFIISYVQKRCNLIWSISCISLGLFISYVSLQVLPIYVPIFLNGAISSFSDEVSYKSLIMRQEQYINPYEMKAGYDDSGNFNYSTSSINLYRFQDAQMESVAKRYSTTEESLKSGKALILDDTSGLFIEGDVIKMNLDRMFNGLSITGSYTGSSNDNVYVLTSKKNVSNVVDYYTPYYLIVDSFIGKLNSTSKVFNIPPSQLHYGNSLFKDSFMVSSYTKSDLFLNRNNLDTLATDNVFESSVVELVKDEFGENNLDWLGLQKVLSGNAFNSNFDAIKNTIWFKTMVKNGYYDSDGNILDADKLAKVITHVNNTTQQLVLENKGQLSYVSDENLIKIISMYALIDFNICVSDFDSVLYPQALNYEELNLENILLPVLTKDYDRYIAQERNIVSYISYDFGPIGLLLFIMNAIMAFLICNIMRLAIPILYLILIVSILARISLKNNKNVTSIIGGFAQIAGGILFSYLAFCYLTATAYKFNDSNFCLFILLIVYAAVLTVMISILMTFISHLGDFSSIKVTSTLGDIGSKFNKLPGIKQLSASIGKAVNKTMELRNKKADRDSRESTRTFHYDEDLYNEKTLNDVMKMRHGYDSYSNPDEKKKKKRKRILYKRDKVTKDYEYESEEDDSFDHYKL